MIRNLLVYFRVYNTANRRVTNFLFAGSQVRHLEKTVSRNIKVIRDKVVGRVRKVFELDIEPLIERVLKILPLRNVEDTDLRLSDNASDEQVLDINHAAVRGDSARVVHQSGVIVNFDFYYVKSKACKRRNR